jgi:hypothetical protein
MPLPRLPSSASAEGLHSLLTVCIGCNLCRASATYVDVGFGDGEGSVSGSRL